MDSASAIKFVVSQINQRDLFAYENTLSTQEAKSIEKSEPALIELVKILNNGTVADMKKVAASNQDIFSKFGIVYEVILAKMNVIEFVSHVNKLAIDQKTDKVELPLAEVAKIADVADELEAEDVVVLATSFGLISGKIDEARSVAIVSSITPVRSLESIELWKALGVKIDQWLSHVQELKKIAKPLTA